MAIVSQMTLTYGSDNSITWEPSSATGIYSNGSIKFVNNSPTLGACEFYLQDADGNVVSDWENGEGRIENTGTVTKTLSELFPGRTLAGYYLYQTYRSPGELLISDQYTACTGPSWCTLDSTLSSGEAVTLRWGKGTAGTNNPIDHYEVWRAEMTSPDADYPEDWDYVGSTTSRSMDVYPPETPGHYYLFSVWAVGANLYDASDDSEWCDSSNLLRRDHDALTGFTDSTLTAGASPVKALHMTELQTAVNTLRAFYGLTAYSFTTITSGQTSLAGWTAHVNEIRAAVDEVCTASGKTHETWIAFSVNCPRADVLSQLRAVVLSI